MAKRHIQAVFALLFLTLPLSAEVKLGPEIPLAPPGEPTPIAATAVNAASNGHDFLVVWQDERATESHVFVTRVDAEGHPANPRGIDLGAGSNPKVARSPAGYLIAWQTADGIQALRVDDDGAPLGPQRRLTAGILRGLFSNGSTFLLVANLAQATMLLDAEGVVRRNLPLGMNDLIGATVRGGRYVLTSGGSVLTIDDDGHAEVTTPLPFGYVVAFGPETILVGTSTGYTVVSYNGGAIIKQATVTKKVPRRDFAAVWDGRQFLLAFSPQEAIRIAADGTPLDAEPFAISSQPSHGLALAFSGSRYLVLWSEETRNGGLVARGVPDLDTLAAAPAPGTHVAIVAESQIDAQIARGGGNVFAVWSDADRYVVRASLNGRPMTIDETTAREWVGWPTVAAGSRVFIVAWRHDVPNDRDRLLARRFDFDGHPLDAAPIVLEASPNAGRQSTHTPASIVFDGSAFFIAWGSASAAQGTPGTLHTIRISQAGTPSEARETVVVPASDGVGPRSVRAFSTGAEFLVVYTIERPPVIHLAFPYFTIATARFDPDNTALTQTPAELSFDEASYTVGAVWTPGRVTYAWIAFDGLYVAQTAADARTLQAPRRGLAAADGLGPPVEIAWNGAEYVLVWLESVTAGSRARKLRGMRLDVHLSPIDDVPFEIYMEPGVPSPPQLVVTPAGALIVYSRSDPAEGGVARAFMRSLERTKPVPRRRTVGH